MTALPPRTPAPPVDPDHALRVGWVAGALAMAAEHEPLTGLTTRGVEIIDDDRGYLDAIRLHAPSGTYLISVERESYR